MKIFYSLFTCSCLIYFKLFHRHQVLGRENYFKGPAILAPNHASFFDPPLIGASCPEHIYYLARGSLFDNRIFKKILKWLNAYPVTGTPQDLTSFKVMAEMIEKGHKVVIFPEGERSHDKELAPIKSGIGMMAMRYKCPIIPVYIAGTYDVWNRHQTLPKLWGKTACVFGKPIHWQDFSDLTKKEAQEQIAKAVEQAILDLKEKFEQGRLK